MSRLKHHLLCRALRGEKVERVPVWAHRQVGRWDLEYLTLRKKRKSMKRLEWSVKASLLPVRFGVDAVTPFYDFTELTNAMGLAFVQKPDFGLTPERPLRSRDDVAKLAAKPEESQFWPVIDLILALRRELNDALPILANVDAPFTLAACCLGLSKDIDMLRIFVREHADVWALLLSRLTEATTMFVRQLVHAGVDALQISDSLAGLLSDDEYDRWALREHKSLVANAPETPTLLYVKNGRDVEAMSACGVNAVSVGSGFNLGDIRRRYPHVAIQGNVDADLLKRGTPEDVIRNTQACLTSGGGQRHILNVDHALANDTKAENFAAFVATARSFRLPDN